MFYDFERSSVFSLLGDALNSHCDYTLSFLKGQIDQVRPTGIVIDANIGSLCSSIWKSRETRAQIECYAMIDCSLNIICNN